ncbi:hypothetical protein [Luteolibacter marinus]|uniref:hypothetical protein n=1 Tax=Luteolibacter marinus TaxID=2776705 RepID=UPI001865A398|nr:hypothetical protein [Luteolibacter marinus]
MKTNRPKSVIATVALFGLPFALYIGAWNWFYHDQPPPSPYYPSATPFSSGVQKSELRQNVDRFSYFLFTPLRQRKCSIERRDIQAASWESCEGNWEASVPVDGGRFQLKFRIEGGNVVFDQAAHWPELSGHTFALQNHEGEGVLCFLTELGEICIQTPAALMFDGGSPDVMYLRTFKFKGWDEKDLELKRANN